MTLLAALRGDRWTRCGPECWTAREPRCSCICDGLLHGAGPDEAARRIAALDVTTLAGGVYVVVMPELPFEVLRAAEEPVAVAAGPMRLPAPRRSRETHCEGCGRPWGDIVLVAMVDAGFLCSDCYDLVRRAS